MERFRQHTVLPYVLTASGFDAEGTSAPITAPVTVTVYGPAGMKVDEGVPDIEGGKLVYELALEKASELGVYRVVWTGTWGGAARERTTELELVSETYYALAANAKLACRVSADVYDEEITDLIDAARDKLRLAGVSTSVLAEPGPLVRRAIIVYCKAHFGLDNPEAERFDASFESLTALLAMGSEYRASSS